MPENVIVGSIVTDKGSEKLVKAAKEGKKLDIKYIVIGDGNGEFYIPTSDQTELKNLCWQGEITSYSVSPDDSKQLVIRGIVPSDVGHFFMREIGVIDSDGDLIAVSNTGAVEFVPYTSGEILNMDITFYIQFKTAEIGAVNIVVHPTDQDIFREEILATVENMVDNVKIDMQEIEDTRIDEIFETTGGSSPGGYPEDWEEATEDDIDSLFD